MGDTMSGLMFRSLVQMGGFTLLKLFGEAPLEPPPTRQRGCRNFKQNLAVCSVVTPKWSSHSLVGLNTSKTAGAK